MLPGALYPVNFTDVVAGDSMTIDPSVLITTLPLKAPLMGSMDVCVEMFFIPDRLYTDALKQNNIATGVPIDVAFPSASISQIIPGPLTSLSSQLYIDNIDESLASGTLIVEPNSLAEFIGLPVGFCDLSTKPASALRFNMNRAIGYIDVIRNYYANLQVLHIPVARPIGVFVGPSGPQVYDFLLSSLDNVVSDPSHFENYFTSREFLKRHGMIFLRTQVPTMLETWLDKTKYDSGAGNVSVQVTNNEVVLQDVRFGSHVLQYMERSLAGQRYDDWLGAQFDVKVQRNLLIPQFLGSFKHVFTVDDIFQTSESTKDSPLGSLAGKGISGQRFSRRTYHFEESGTFMCMLSLRPKPDYCQGIDPMLLKLKLRDKYAPALDRIGFQALPVAWLNATPVWRYSDPKKYFAQSWDANIFANPFTASLGYQPAWSEYRTGFNRLHGNLTGVQRYWTWARKYSNGLADVTPTTPFTPLDATAGANILNTMFVGSLYSPYVFPWYYNDCFADVSPDAENFIYQLKLDIKCNREISKLNMPSFFM